MKTKISLAAAVGTLSLALAACGGNDADDRTAGAYGADAPADTLGADSGLGGTGDGMVGATDTSAMNDPMGAGAMDGADGGQMPLAMVMAVDQHEIAAAEQAQSKGVSGEVAEYAETLLQDHTRNLEATRDLMGRAGGGAMADAAEVDDPQVRQMREKHESERERLAGLEGEEYQRAWLEAMVTGHTEALAMLDEQLIPGATDNDVRSHLQTTRQAIARHLETAQRLRDANGTAAE